MPLFQSLVQWIKDLDTKDINEIMNSGQEFQSLVQWIKDLDFVDVPAHEPFDEFQSLVQWIKDLDV